MFLLVKNRDKKRRKKNIRDTLIEVNGNFACRNQLDWLDLPNQVNFEDLVLNLRPGFEISICTGFEINIGFKFHAVTDFF
jgi:hypothetical protein